MAAIIADRDGGQNPSAYKVELKSGDRLAGTGHLAAAHLADHSTAVAVLQACLKVYLFCVPIRVGLLLVDRMLSASGNKSASMAESVVRCRLQSLPDVSTPTHDISFMEYIFMNRHLIACCIGC